MLNYIYSISLILLTSCASVSSGKKFDLSKISELKKCITNKSDLERLFGKPFEGGYQSGFNTNKWYYFTASAGMFSSSQDKRELIVFLNESNVLVDYAVNAQGIVEVKNSCK